jgi:hypothetical protein
MKFLLSIIYFIFLLASATGHDHNEPQMPLDYVKFPYQAVYPGDGEGLPTPIAPSRPWFSDTCIQ